MKKIIVVLLALSLGGCANLDFSRSILAGGASITQKTHNPITRDMLYGIENGFTVAVAGLVAYKRECIKGTIDVGCRMVIQNVQQFTRQAKPLIISLRTFVRNNDQINAVDVYNELVDILNVVLKIKQSAGVK